MEPRSPGLFFGLFCLVASLVAFAELMVSVAPGRDEATVWAVVAAVWPFASAFYLHMALRAAGRSWVRPWVLVPVYLLAVAITLVFLLEVRRGAIVLASPIRGYLLVTPSLTEWPAAFVPLAQSVFLVGTITVLVLGAFRTQGEARHRQLLWILISYAAGALVGPLMVVLRQLGEVPVREMTGPQYLVVAGLFYFGVGRKFLVMLAPQKVAGHALNQIDELLILTDEDYRIVSANVAATGRLSVEDQRVVGSDVRSLLGPPVDPWEPEITGADGTELRLSVSETAWTNHLGEIVGRILVGRDVTRERQKDEELQRSLIEQQALTQELHHRVRNSLQVIRSLLDLKSLHAVSSDAKAIVEVLQLRVGAMADVQNQIYAEDHMHAIRLDHAVASLVERWYATVDTRLITLKLELEAVRVPVASAVPLILAAAELLSNTGDHAFPGGRVGNVCVRLIPDPPSHSLLEISDDGCGYSPETVGPMAGLLIVRNLVEQIGGQFHSASVGGTRCTIRVPAGSTGLLRNT